MANATPLHKGLDLIGVALRPEQIELLIHYLTLLDKWNKVYNLTAITEWEQMVSGHLLDSLSLVPYLKREESPILDVGTGAGLPGIPLAIAFPEVEVILLDSNGKKTRFLQQCKIELKLHNIQVVKDRVEDYRGPTNFAIVVSRAFSSLERFFHTTEHLLRSDGRWLAMKGRDPANEINLIAAKYSINEITPLQVPFLNADRHLVVARPQD